MQLKNRYYFLISLGLSLLSFLNLTYIGYKIWKLPSIFQELKTVLYQLPFLILVLIFLWLVHLRQASLINNFLSSLSFDPSSEGLQEAINKLSKNLYKSQNIANYLYLLAVNILFFFSLKINEEQAFLLLILHLVFFVSRISLFALANYVWRRLMRLYLLP